MSEFDIRKREWKTKKTPFMQNEGIKPLDILGAGNKIVFIFFFILNLLCWNKFLIYSRQDFLRTRYSKKEKWQTY